MLCFSHKPEAQTFNLIVTNTPDATLRSMVASSLFTDNNWWGALYAGGRDVANRNSPPAPPATTISNQNSGFGSAIRSLTDRATITPERLEILRHEALRSLEWLKPKYATAITAMTKQQNATVILHIIITTPENKEINFNATFNQ